MLIFHYDAETGEILSAGDARRHPIKSDEFIIPGFATTIAPPAPNAGFARVFDEESQEWSYVEDHRGVEVWVDHEQSYIIDDLGPIPDGYLLEKPAPPPPPPPPPPTEAEKRKQVNESLLSTPRHGFGGPTLGELLNAGH